MDDAPARDARRPAGDVEGGDLGRQPQVGEDEDALRLLVVVFVAPLHLPRDALGLARALGAALARRRHRRLDPSLLRVAGRPLLEALLGEHVALLALVAVLRDEAGRLHQVAHRRLEAAARELGLAVVRLLLLGGALAFALRKGERALPIRRRLLHELLAVVGAHAALLDRRAERLHELLIDAEVRVGLEAPLAEAAALEPVLRLAEAGAARQILAQVVAAAPLLVGVARPLALEAVGSEREQLVGGELDVADRRDLVAVDALARLQRLLRRVEVLDLEARRRLLVRLLVLRVELLLVVRVNDPRLEVVVPVHVEVLGLARDRAEAAGGGAARAGDVLRVRPLPEHHRVLLVEVARPTCSRRGRSTPPPTW